MNLYPVQGISESLLWTYDCKLPQLTFATLAILQPQLAFDVTENKTDTYGANEMIMAPFDLSKTSHFVSGCRNNVGFPSRLTKYKFSSPPQHEIVKTAYTSAVQKTHLACHEKSKLQT